MALFFHPVQASKVRQTMLTNYSSFSNLSVNSESYQCPADKFIILISAFIITKSVLIFPFAVFVLYQGYQRWQQRSIKNVSNADIFTYHLTLMELIGTFWCPLYLCGFAVPYLFTLGIYVVSSFVCGEVVFYLLTCVECYIAVVHPITYLAIKTTGWTRIRNICIGCVWLFSFGWVGLMFLYAPDTPTIHFFCFMMFCFIVVSFCSISVLCVLIRPGPGEVGGDRKRVDQSKRKSFHTVMAITAVLWFIFVGDIICAAVKSSAPQGYYKCLLLPIGLWLTLPSSFVLPLLFLYRAGKLTCC